MTGSGGRINTLAMRAAFRFAPMASAVRSAAAILPDLLCRAAGRFFFSAGDGKKCGMDRVRMVAQRIELGRESTQALYPNFCRLGDSDTAFFAAWDGKTDSGKADA